MSSASRDLAVWLHGGQGRTVQVVGDRDSCLWTVTLVAPESWVQATTAGAPSGPSHVRSWRVRRDSGARDEREAEYHGLGLPGLEFVTQQAICHWEET